MQYEMKVVRLITCYSSIEAADIQQKLEISGIKSFLTNENFSNLAPHYNGIYGGGIHIMIREEDVVEAIEIVNPERSKNELCPFCGSDKIKYGIGTRRMTKIATVLMSLLVLIPFGNIRNKYYCANCKNEISNT